MAFCIACLALGPWILRFGVPFWLRFEWECFRERPRPNKEWMYEWERHQIQTLHLERRELHARVTRIQAEAIQCGATIQPDGSIYSRYSAYTPENQKIQTALRNASQRDTQIQELLENSAKRHREWVHVNQFLWGVRTMFGVCLVAFFVVPSIFYYPAELLGGHSTNEIMLGLLSTIVPLAVLMISTFFVGHGFGERIHPLDKWPPPTPEALLAMYTADLAEAVED